MKRIPKIFHFVFGLKPQTEPFHFCYYLTIQSCIEVNKPDKVYFHYENMPYGEWWERTRELVELHKIEPDAFMSQYTYQDVSIEKFRYAHVSDIIRLQVLLKYGGVYADIDTIFVNPLPESLYEYPCVMGKEKVDWKMLAAQQAGGSLCNAFIMAEKNADFIVKWLEHIYDAFDGTWSAHSTFLPYRLSQEFPQFIHVEPERSFFYFDWSKEGIEALFEKRHTDFDKIYNVHLWNHLWWDRKSTNFSLFYEKFLTPEFAAFSQTTYSLMAQKSLPSDFKLSKTKYHFQKLNWNIERNNLKLLSKIKLLLK